MKKHEICISAISPIINNIRLKNLDQGKGLSGRKLKKNNSPPALDPTWNNITKRQIINVTA